MADTLFATLPDGRTIDSREYWNTPEWRAVCEARRRFDNGLCVICHAPAQQWHHIDNRAYGHERITDVISVCIPCHKRIHSLWDQKPFWKPADNDSHWEVYSLEHTARLCAMYYHEDKYLGGDCDVNMCSLDVCRDYIDRYHIETGNMGTVISQQDVQLLIRNKRYELWFNSGCNDILEFLDKQFGEKVRGGNKIRQDAEKFYYKKWIQKGQDPATGMKETYEENQNIKILMQEVKKYE